jgi:hypothetical protein
VEAGLDPTGVRLYRGQGMIDAELPEQSHCVLPETAANVIDPVAAIFRLTCLFEDNGRPISGRPTMANN